MSTEKKPILFIDSDCLMCSSFAHFVIRHSSDIQIAPLGGESAKELLNPAPQVDSIVYFDGSANHIRSTAVLLAAKKFAFPWNMLYLFKIFPIFLRDYVYDQVAKRRKKLIKAGDGRVKFSEKTEYCEMLKPEDRERILN